MERPYEDDEDRSKTEDFSSTLGVIDPADVYDYELSEYDEDNDNNEGNVESEKGGIYERIPTPMYMEDWHEVALSFMNTATEKGLHNPGQAQHGNDDDNDTENGGSLPLTTHEKVSDTKTNEHDPEPLYDDKSDKLHEVKYCGLDEDTTRTPASTKETRPTSSYKQNDFTLVKEELEAQLAKRFAANINSRNGVGFTNGDAKNEETNYDNDNNNTEAALNRQASTVRPEIATGTSFESEYSYTIATPPPSEQDKMSLASRTASSDGNLSQPTDTSKQAGYWRENKDGISSPSQQAQNPKNEVDHSVPSDGCTYIDTAHNTSDPQTSQNQDESALQNTSNYERNPKQHEAVSKKPSTIMLMDSVNQEMLQSFNRPPSPPSPQPFPAQISQTPKLPSIEEIDKTGLDEVEEDKHNKCHENNSDESEADQGDTNAADDCIINQLDDALENENTMDRSFYGSYEYMDDIMEETSAPEPFDYEQVSGMERSWAGEDLSPRAARATLEPYPTTSARSRSHSPATTPAPSSPLPQSRATFCEQGEETERKAPAKPPRKKKLSRRRGGFGFSTKSEGGWADDFHVISSWDKKSPAMSSGSLETDVADTVIAYVTYWVESSKEMPRRTAPLYVRKVEHRERLLTQKTVKASGFVMMTNTRRKKVQQLSKLFENLSYTLALWGKSIRDIEGHHGAGVASYFLFLRWLFGLNIVLFVLMLSFVVLPMGIADEDPLTASTDTTYNTSYYCSQNYTVVEGSGINYVLEFIQGTGWMEKTLLFYGYYVSQLKGSYNLPIAYVLTVLACLLVSLGLMARYTGKSFKQALLNATNSNFEYSNKVFGAWDYLLTDPEAADLKKKGIHYDLQSDMMEQTFMKKRIERLEQKCSMCKLYMLRLIVNFLIVLMLGGAAYLIYYVTDFSSEYSSDNKDASGIDSWLLLLVQYLPSLTITICNAILPLIFEKVVLLEDYSQAFVIKITLIRTVFLRLASVIVLVLTMYTEITCTPQDTCRANIAPTCTELKCWETYVGQQFYKLVIMDFLVAVVKVFAVELPRRLLYEKCECGLIQKIGPPEFNIPSNVLDLVYGMCLIWLGFLYSPMLPGIAVVKYTIIFYVKKLSALKACPPSEKPYKASRINTFFMIILLLTYFLCALPVIFSIFGVHPSRSCGPFRVLDYMNESIKNTVETWPSVLSSLYDLITSAAVTGTIIILLCMAVYYLRTMSTAHKARAELFKEQLIMEGRDKQFLLTKLQEMYGSSNRKKPDKPSKKNASTDKVTTVNEQEHNTGSFSPPHVVDNSGDW